MFNRWDICAAYYHFDIGYNPTGYGARLDRIGYRPSRSEELLQNISPGAKQIYGQLCMQHNRLYIGYSRYCRRNRNAPIWPGTQNMRRGPEEWIKSVGAWEAVQTLVR
jgi:hypothetical protein